MLQLTSGDQVLWAYARSVEREYGEGVFLHAALKVDRYEARGMFKAALVWRSVLKRIEVRNGYCVRARRRPLLNAIILHWLPLDRSAFLTDHAVQHPVVEREHVLGGK